MRLTQNRIALVTSWTCSWHFLSSRHACKSMVGFRPLSRLRCWATSFSILALGLSPSLATLLMLHSGPIPATRLSSRHTSVNRARRTCARVGSRCQPLTLATQNISIDCRCKIHPSTFQARRQGMNPCRTGLHAAVKTVKAVKAVTVVIRVSQSQRGSAKVVGSLAAAGLGRMMLRWARLIPDRETIVGRLTAGTDTRPGILGVMHDGVGRGTGR